MPKGKTAKQHAEAGTAIAPGQVWKVKTASGKIVKAKLVRPIESTRGRWYAINLATTREIQVNARGFIEKLDTVAAQEPTVYVEHSDGSGGGNLPVSKARRLLEDGGVNVFRSMGESLVSHPMSDRELAQMLEMPVCETGYSAKAHAKNECTCMDMGYNGDDDRMYQGEERDRGIEGV